MNTPNENASPSFFAALYDENYSLEERKNAIVQASNEEVVSVFLNEMGTIIPDFESVIAEGFRGANYSVNEEALTAKNEILVAKIKEFLIADINDFNSKSAQLLFDELVETLLEIGFLEAPTIESIHIQIASLSNFLVPESVQVPEGVQARSKKRKEDERKRLMEDLTRLGVDDAERAHAIWKKEHDDKTRRLLTIAGLGDFLDPESKKAK